MSSRLLFPILLLVFGLTIAGVAKSALEADRFASAGFAVLFVATAIGAGWKTSRDLLAPGLSANGRQTLQATALSRLTLILALTYAWGATAMYVDYSWSTLHWRHGWQYALAMALVAGALAYYGRYLGQAGQKDGSASVVERGFRLAAVHGLAAGTALVWMITSGKLQTPKDDWAANHVFVAGGLAIVFLSALAVRVHQRLAERRD